MRSINDGNARSFSLATTTTTRRTALGGAVQSSTPPYALFLHLLQITLGVLWRAPHSFLTNNVYNIQNPLASF